MLKTVAGNNRASEIFRTAIEILSSCVSSKVPWLVGEQLWISPQGRSQIEFVLVLSGKQWEIVPWSPKFLVVDSPVPYLVCGACGRWALRLSLFFLTQANPQIMVPLVCRGYLLQQKRVLIHLLRRLIHALTVRIADSQILEIDCIMFAAGILSTTVGPCSWLLLARVLEHMHLSSCNKPRWGIWQSSNTQWPKGGSDRVYISVSFS